MHFHNKQTKPILYQLPLFKKKIMFEKIKTYIEKNWRYILHRVNKEQLKLSPKQFTFLFFFVLSTIFWFLNALSREYIDVVKFPVKYHNYPEKLVLLNTPPQHLNLQVSAFGYSLFYHKMTPDLPAIDINFNKAPIRNITKGDTSIYYIETNYLQNEVSRQLNSNIKLKEIKPDTITFKFTRTIKKRVPVVFQHNIQLNKPFRIKGKVLLSPDSITIQGPSSVVKQTDSILTETYTTTNCKENILKNITLKPIENITFEEGKVKFLANVERYTEGEVSVDITIKNLPDSLKLTIFPNRLRVKFLAGLDIFTQVTEHNFQAHVDFENTKHTLSNKIPVHLTLLVSDVNLVQYTPRHVEFYIEKK